MEVLPGGSREKVGIVGDVSCKQKRWNIAEHRHEQAVWRSFQFRFDEADLPKRRRLVKKRAAEIGSGWSDEEKFRGFDWLGGAGCVAQTQTTSWICVFLGEGVGSWEDNTGLGQTWRWMLTVVAWPEKGRPRKLSAVPALACRRYPIRR